MFKYLTPNKIYVQNVSEKKHTTGWKLVNKIMMILNHSTAANLVDIMAQHIASAIWGHFAAALMDYSNQYNRSPKYLHIGDDIREFFTSIDLDTVFLAESETTLDVPSFFIEQHNEILHYLIQFTKDLSLWINFGISDDCYCIRVSHYRHTPLAALPPRDYSNGYGWAPHMK